MLFRSGEEIYVLPFSPDRIVQHALMNVIAPIWDDLMIHDSYACRPGKGQHRASRKTMESVKKYDFCYQGDIKKFYPSIKHDILMKIVKNKIKDLNVLWLLEDIIYSIDGGKNIPIGNFTSQWLGNLYLNELDMYVKHELKIKNYIRYNDDFCLFHNDKEYLRNCRSKIEEFVAKKLDLIVSKQKLFPVCLGVDFIGYRHFPEKVLLRKSTAKRMKKKIAMKVHSYKKGIISAKQLEASLQSTKGWLIWAQTYNYRKAINLDVLLEEVQSA